MRPTGTALCLAALLSGCGAPPATPSPDASVPDAPATARRFRAPQPWARPIDDYQRIGEAERPGVYDPGIHDLAPFAGRLWIGYGDATYNLGTFVPIEFRAFASPDRSAAEAAAVDAAGHGAEQQTPTQSGEEQIDRYRVLDGALWQAGIDSTDADERHTQRTTNPRGIAGNVYRLDGDAWRKRRTVVGGEHVHDLAAWRGALYAVGSGADTRAEFEAGRIFRYLWRSTTQGDGFDTVLRVQHPTPREGDTRWVHLLPTAGRLFVFGYESTFATRSTSIRNAAWDGTMVSPLDDAHPLRGVFATGTESLPGGEGLVWGVDVAQSPRRSVLLHVAADGRVTPRPELAGWTVVDVSASETGERVVLLTLGDAPGPAMAPVTARVVAWPDTSQELVRWQSPVPVRAVALWAGALYVGTADGQVLRAGAE